MMRHPKLKLYQAIQSNKSKKTNSVSNIIFTILLTSCIVVLSLSLVSCNGSGSNTNSPQNISASTLSSAEISQIVDKVHMLAPVNRARSINPRSPITFVIDKPIDVTHLSKNDITLVSSDSKTVISGTTTANGVAYTFKPDTPLHTKTTYIIKLNAGLINAATAPNNFVSVGSFTTASEKERQIFVTEGTDGYFLNKYPSTLNSTDAADKICNTSHNKPIESMVYKAMIGSSNRWGCDKDGNCGEGFAKDWVLAPNTDYYNNNNEIIFTTNELGIFDFSKSGLTHPFNTNNGNAWTGLTDQWRTNNNTCDDWQYKNSDKTGRAGVLKSTNKNAISDEQRNCDNKQSLYCVPQGYLPYITQDSLHVFVATNNGKGFHGDFKHSGGTSENGTIGADEKCNYSSDKPITALSDAKYKAIIGSNVRRVCDMNANCGSNYQLDWVLQPNTNYYNDKNQLIGTTTAKSIFPMPLINSILAENGNAWTGLTSSWGNYGGCNNWSNNDGGVGIAGKINSQQMTFLDASSLVCDKKYYLYCAEQPVESAELAVSMTTPAADHRTNVATDVKIELEFQNDLKENSVNDHNIYLEEVVYSKNNPVSYAKIPSTLIVKNSREVEIDPIDDLAESKIYRVTESNVQSTAGRYQQGTQWYFATNQNIAGPKLVNRLVESITATFTEVFPADTDISTIIPGTTVNLYKTSATAEDIDNDSHVTGGLVAIPFAMVGEIVYTGGLAYVTYHINEALYPGEKLVFDTHDTKNTSGKIQKSLKKTIRVIYETFSSLYRTKPWSNTDVPVDTKIILTSLGSSDPLNPATINTNTVTVTQKSKDGDAEVAVPITVTPGMSSIFIKPQSTLNYESVVTVTVSGATRVSGAPVTYKGSFTTVASDAPVMVYPYESTNIALNSQIIFKFPRPVNPDSVNRETFKVTYNSTNLATNSSTLQESGNDIPGTYYLEESGIELVWTPTNPPQGPPLPPEAALDVIIDGIVDQNGVPFLAVNFQLLTVADYYHGNKIVFAADNREFSYSDTLGYSGKFRALNPGIIENVTNSLDYICEHDSSLIPHRLSRFKAVIGFPNERYPRQLHTDKERLDWPVYANQTYYYVPNENLLNVEEYFGTTNGDGIFISHVPLNFLTTLNIWFGMEESSSDVDFFWKLKEMETCNSWSSQQNSYTGRSIINNPGSFNHTDVVPCNERQAVLCVEL